MFSFSVDSDYTADHPSAAQFSRVQTTRFEVSLHRGVLQLEGHTVSSIHEQQLLRTTELLFSGVKLNTRFVRLASARDQWAATTVTLLEALSTTQSCNAILTGTTLRIRGVASEAWSDQLRTLGKALPRSIELDVDFVIPDSRIRVADLCARALATHDEDAVYFEESGTAFRSSAYGVLDRIIALADACRDSTISITGHSDSSGYEASNQQLSLARAKSVADYVAGHGIARERLVVEGAGSSLPKADNATRYGRSLNRRITINLRRREAAEGV